MSVFLAATAQGIAVFMLFGAGLVAGLLGQIGDALSSRSLMRISDIAEVMLPFEALYQAGLYLITTDASGFTRTIIELGPFGGADSAGPGLVLFAVGLHRRRDRPRRRRVRAAGSVVAPTLPRVVDTHAHLGLCDDPAEDLVARAGPAGVGRILTVGLDEESNEGAVALARAYDAVFACVGRHPNSAAGFDSGAEARLRELAADDAVAAVGETGLDFYREGASRDDQLTAFRAQIGIARERRASRW